MDKTKDMNELLENKELREEAMENIKDRLDLLEKVKDIVTLPFGELHTLEEVAKYYEVTKEAILNINRRNEDELLQDGYKVYSKEDIKNLLTNDWLVKTKRGGFDVIRANSGNDEIIFSGSNKGVGLFTTRSVLRLGMLLQGSGVAEEVRTQILNVMEKVDNNTKTEELNKEMKMYMDIMFAKSDLDRAVAINELQKYQERYKEQAEKYTKIYESDGLYTVTEIAKDLGMNARKLNKILHDKGIQYKGQNGSWYLYSKYEHLVPEYCDYHITEYGQSLKWKNKGREWIIELLGEENK